MSSAVTAYIALGSNRGDRRRAIDSAIEALSSMPGVRVTAVSGIIETEPVGPADQPRYLNAAAALETTLSARDLLDAFLRIEAAHGRDRRRQQRWGPRELDIDLLLYGDAIIEQEGLRVPHPHLHERDFVLRPLAQIAPAAVHPALGETIESLLDRLRRPRAAEYGGAARCSSS